MSYHYLVDHGLYEMIFLAIGILLVGLYSTYLNNKKDAEDEYFLVNTRTGKTKSIKINRNIPEEERRRILCDRVGKVFQ